MTLRRAQIVFVDGIGGRRRFRQALFKHFIARGHVCHHFDYRPSREALEDIRTRLVDHLMAVAGYGPYVLVGYSFGGVLARSALMGNTLLMRPQRLVLIASPMRALQMCKRVGNWPVFRWLTGDCGQLLASEVGMQAVGLPDVTSTCIYGTRGYAGPFALAGRSPNDGMVAVVETSPQLFDDVVAVHASHPFIATCQAVIDAIQARVSTPTASAAEVPTAGISPG